MINYKSSFLLLLLLIFSCHSLILGSEKTSEQNIDLADHIIRANEDGLAIDPNNKNNKLLTKDKFEEYIEDMLEKANELGKKKSKNESRENNAITIKILIHVHGGLNKYEDTNDRVKSLAKIIMSEKKKDDWHYPIFISWPSDVLDTYGEQLFRIRKGVKAKRFIGLIGAPFVAISHLGISIGKIPVNGYYHIANSKDILVTRFGPKNWLSRVWKESDTNYKKIINRETGWEYDVYRGRFKTSKRDKYLRHPYQFITTPSRLTLGSLIHSSFGDASWENMRRRTSNILFPVHLFDERYRNGGVAAGEFFSILLKRIEAKKKKNKHWEYEITVVGHSMGAIVLNKVLSQYQEKWINSGSLKNIIYMAAASTIIETKNTIVPLLNGNKKIATEFYNLTLNRVAEIAEPVAKYLAPSGSLLVYIDHHYQKPEMMLDRTIGTEVNILSSIVVFKEIKQNVHFKSFDRKSGHVPSRHGDFNKSPFWRKSFWETDTQYENTGYNCYPKKWLKKEKKESFDYH